ncbi:GNAT family N-acetyltransferase [Actinoallomurus liliacearum]|uniref:GNAT family N-acetyltransferase n=1 Tax=Actinoallomurus liliacearum TaxID=1080073 RepID=A0ABP8U0L0_9ACTN
MSIRITPLTDPAHTHSSRRLAWLATHPDGTPAGSAFLRLFTRPGETHRADLDLTVHPAERRRGVGTRLLAAAAGAARDDGRRNVFALVEAGSPGELFLRARDFRRVLTLTYARLALAQVDPDRLARIVARPHPGYRLASWDGVVPDELAATFAASRRAMDDMPMGDTDYGTQTWDVDRVRAAARAVGDRGDLLHTVVAIDESNGSIAGFTELVVRGDGKGDAQHYGTGVLPEHRGHGLGLWMKAESIRQAGERHPALDGLLTDTADGNRSMRAINDSLGYEPTHREYGYQLDI